MKARLSLAGLLMLCSCLVLAQHPLVGTWQLVSIKGTQPDGTAFSLDNTSVREIKVITATHYMLIQQSLKGDSITFVKSDAGTVRLEGSKYIETPLYSSSTTVPDAKIDFNWKLENDRFNQTGTVTFPDGRKVVLDILFRRAASAEQYPKNPSLGVWDQLSSSFTLPDGTKGSHTRETASRFEIITPTHWMRISHRNNVFENAGGAVYTMDGNKSVLMLEIASYPIDKRIRSEMVITVKGDKRFTDGVVTFGDGSKMSFKDEFQRVAKY